MQSTESLMRRAFDLAQKGLGFVSPNPLVGCVIVKNGVIVGEGYHQKYGGPHAEVNAVNSVSDPNLLVNSTVIVSLEPCSHHGLTPPCASLLIKKNVGEVIISNVDPNPLVNGNGLRMLESAGIKVKTGILSNEGQHLNRRFFTLIEKSRPYVILKWAQTKDGFIARKDYSSKWISSEESRKLVHKWRHEESGILVGTNTAKHDNPSLNVRDWNSSNPQNPVRIVVDKKLILRPDINLFDGSSKTVCLNSLKEEETPNVIYVKVSDNNDFLPEALDRLGKMKIQSIIVEGGTITLQSFIDKNLWDEARVFESDNCFKEGIKAPKLTGELVSQNPVGNDTLTVFKNHS